MKSKDIINIQYLIRDIIHTLWIGVGLYLIGTSVNLFFTTADKWDFTEKVIVIPTIQLVVVMILLEICYKKQAKYMEYWVILAIAIIVNLIILGLQTMSISFFLLIFPVIISLYFYKTRILRFASYLAIASFLFIYSFSETIRSSLKHSDIIFIITIIIAVTLLIYSLMKHSYRMADELLKTAKEKQDLFSKNIHMERLTRVDPVTELYNHRSFHEHLESILSFDSPDKFNVHVAILDIDNFKQINDTYGHRAGDFVIIEVAKQIQSYMEGDDFPTRYGGEEFAIVSVGPTTKEFYQKVEKIRERIANLKLEELSGKNVTVSAGVQGLIPGMDKEHLFKGADLALYQAKKSGKNRTIVSEKNNI